ncbi:hypothetical protein D0Z00_002595, partial [Geotrichum galactomycetum]
AVEVSRDYPVVITKYIENAKEIEMDAVAKDGKLLMHVVSEHVENAGVHSGDATLIVPPQDLDPETVKRIVVATAKIGNALNVTGPFNIQFIAKNNDIKVIECNVRASRSFPFVSKVLGVDLIEMATKAICGFDVEPYPLKKIPEDYVAIKVPQFSFSRLSGADPILGVEMASTGEVATFGRNKYEAYLKSLIATGFTLPKKNILLSVGSFKEKQELLPSVKKLHELGYKLFATAGTADFIQEHGIPVQYLEVLPEGEDEKSEYSLSQHLANNLIDLYINLPSSNRFRRPANYMSKGYRTRRMAVDYAVPLVTNVKCAKLLVEALALNITLDISSIDAQTSHTTVTLPGLINISTFVPNLITPNSSDFAEVTKLALASGFTMNRILPSGVDGQITNARDLAVAQENAKGHAYTDFNFSISATDSNASQLHHVTGNVGSLLIPFNQLSNNVSKVATVTSHFGVWPSYKPIVTDAKGTDLASILLLASLHNRPIHITNVTSKEDIEIVALSKEKGLNVSCDVSIYALFFSREEFPKCAFLPSKSDIAALWENLETIDIFSVGSLPALMAHALGETNLVGAGTTDSLPLLFSAIRDGRLTIEQFTDRLYHNPKRIFELHDQADTSVEINLDLAVTKNSRVWSPATSGQLCGSIERVTFNGRTLSLNGKLSSSDSFGHDVSSLLIPRTASIAAGTSNALGLTSVPFDVTPASPSVTRKSARLSFSTPLAQGRASPRIFRDSVVEDESPIPARADEITLAREPAPPTALAELLKNNPFLRRNVTSVGQFSRTDLHHLFTLAQEMRLAVERVGVLDILKGRVLATLFYEPSTRTHSSFDAAMQRLGGRVINVPTESSSVKKGETLQDTVRTLACYADAIVLRHPSEDSAAIAAKYSPVPVINGGNGALEHPTQAFLDLFTIREEFGTVKGLTITFVGDLKHGRPVHSLCKLLQYYDVKVQLVSPAELSLPADIKAQLKEKGILSVESEELTDDIIAASDVIYSTRIQKERFSNLADFDRLKDTYIIDARVLRIAKRHMCIMHPLPRNNEISEEVDFDQRAAYFRQMRYGMFVRMALLALVVGAEL